jgi:hypothetical protein
MRATHIIILICAIVFVLQMANLANENFVFRPIDLLAMPWTIITSMFAHGDFEHILFNMFALFMFGSILEEKIGTNRFIFLYLISGLLGSVGFMLFNSPFDSALGASGAIYGILGALVLLAPQLQVFIYFFPVPMWLAGPIYAAIEIFALGKADNIAHSAHLLGFVAGLALATQEMRPSWPPKPDMSLLKALAIPIALSFAVAIIAGVYYTADELNKKMVECEYKETIATARSCFISLASEYKNNLSQQKYICSEYDRYFIDNACGV